MRGAVILLAGLCLFAGRARAGLWTNLAEKDWYAGPKLTAGALSGKVVMVAVWSEGERPGGAEADRLEELWRSFKNKPFVMVASHRGGRQEDAVRAVSGTLTFPVYEGFGLAKGEPNLAPPFLYVVNHRGRVVFSGRGDREATDAFVTAIGDVGRPIDIVAGAGFKWYKGMRPQLKLGKSVASAVKKLQGEVKRLEKAGRRTPVQDAQLEEAKEILAALENGKAEVAAEIESLREANPAEAVRLIKLCKATYPDLHGRFASELPALDEAAAAQKSAAKTQGGKPSAKK